MTDGWRVNEVAGHKDNEKWVCWTEGGGGKDGESEREIEIERERERERERDSHNPPTA